MACSTPARLSVSMLTPSGRYWDVIMPGLTANQRCYTENVDRSNVDIYIAATKSNYPGAFSSL